MRRYNEDTELAAFNNVVIRAHQGDISLISNRTVSLHGKGLHSSTSQLNLSRF